MKQLFNDDSVKKDAMKGDTKYSRAIKVPQYNPSDIKPAITDLYNTDKYRTLIAKINKSNVSEEEKKFLKFAASRHIVFTYSKIADYYAHSDKEMQELMEESALVILDMDDAIANGYVALSEKMQQLIEEEKQRDLKAREAKRILKEQRMLAEKKKREEEEAKRLANQKKKNKKSDDEQATVEEVPVNEVDKEELPDE